MAVNGSKWFFAVLYVLVALSLLANAKPSRTVQNFAKWLKDKDVDVGPLQLRDIGRGYGGRGVFAAEDIIGGTRILRVPIKTAVISLDDAVSSPGLTALFNDMYLPDEDTWAIFLVHELRQDDSPWADYLRVLPTTFTTPLYYSDEELEVLKESPNYFYAKNRQSAVRRSYERISQKIFTRHPNVFANENDYSFEDHLWGLSIMWSRVMEIKIKATELQKMQQGEFQSDWVPINVLVPMVDMMNTGAPEEINVICRTHSSGDYVDCVADRNIPAGTEILRVYHEFKEISTSQYFNDFGIAFEFNKDDSYSLVMPDVGQVPFLQQKQYIISKFPPILNTYLSQDTKDRLDVTLNWKRPLPQFQGLMPFLRVLSMTQKDLDKPLPKIFKLCDSNKPISLASEKNAVDVLTRLINDRLSAYPTTIEEDSAELDDLYKDDATHDFHAATNRRISKTVLFAEKNLLTTHINWLNEHYDNYKASLEKRKKKEKSTSSDPSPPPADSTNAQTNEDEDGEHEYKVNPNWRKTEL